jgi:phosphoserine phosphatase
MNGEFDFSESLRERVKLLEGLEESKLEDILKSIKLTDGVVEFVNTVKSLGYKVAIISGGFQYFANAFKDKLGIDYAFANDLEIKDGLVTGEVLGSIVDAQKKADLLEMLAQTEGFNLEQVVAIGDGANDLQMLAKAGLGIAFHAKDVVRETAKQHMSHGPMTSILYFLGIPGTKVD